MGAPDRINQADLVRLTGISQALASTSFRGKLKEAVRNGKLDLSHPKAQEFVRRWQSARDRGTGRRMPKLSPANADLLKNAPTPAGVIPPDRDPFALAADLSTDPLSALVDELPGDLYELPEMTLREIADKFGTLERMHSTVKSLKDHAAYVNGSVQARQRRGLLIERRAVEQSVIPLVDQVFKRVVGEMPEALSEQIIARVLAGGADLAIDVASLIRDEASSILRDCKEEALNALNAIDSGVKRGRPKK